MRYIVESHIRGAAKQRGFRIAHRYLEALSRKVEALVDQSCRVAKSERRLTLQEEHLHLDEIVRSLNHQVHRSRRGV